MPEGQHHHANQGLGRRRELHHPRHASGFESDQQRTDRGHRQHPGIDQIERIVLAADDADRAVDPDQQHGCDQCDGPGDAVGARAPAWRSGIGCTGGRHVGIS
ncbi:MAG TPA: hypothetical protein VN581_02575 [Patescibacteria group bacterium]|nr:hypothetical protein [Patescibacteria group bacterium]